MAYVYAGVGPLERGRGGGGERWEKHTADDDGMHGRGCDPNGLRDGNWNDQTYSGVMQLINAAFFNIMHAHVTCR